MNDAGAWQVERWQQAGWRTRRWIVFSAMLTMGLMLGQPVRAQTISDTLRYDERGNLNRLTLEGLVIDHRYDGIDRLRAETGAGNQQFDLDADGNRLADRTSRYRVAPGAQRLADRDGVALVHGPAGHLLSDRVRMGGQWLPREFTWNLAGQLDTVRINGVVVASYRYNAAGQRTRKTLTNPPPGVPAVTLYRHDPEGQLVMEVAGSPAQTPGLAVSVGQVLVRYIWHDATPVAIIWPPRTPGNPNGTSDRIVYLHTDHLNTPRRATDARGVMVWMWTSDAYGASLPHEDVAGDGFRTVINLRFPGQYYDAESGLHYNWHRYYDPQVGRYTQSDPIGLEGGNNTYTYVDGNPVTHTDPEGLLAWGVLFGGADLAWQLHQNGGKLRCVDWRDVGLSMLGGGLVNALGKGAFAFKTTGSHTWNATRSWMNRRGIQTLGLKQQRHHWLFEQNQGVGKNIPNAIKNQPYNTNPISAEFNNWLSRRPELAWLGGPSWAGEVSGGAALIIGGENDCSCQR